MQMYMWAPPGRPYREGSVDGDVIAHEFGHAYATKVLGGRVAEQGGLEAPRLLRRALQLVRDSGESRDDDHHRFRRYSNCYQCGGRCVG